MKKQISIHHLPAVVFAVVISCFGAPTLATAQQQSTDSGQPASAASERGDGQVEMDVVHALDAEESLKQDWITAGTVQGEVTLSGTSASETNRKTAEAIAAQIPGVTRVVNNLKVGDPQAAQAADLPEPGVDGQAVAGQAPSDQPYSSDMAANPAPQPQADPNQIQGGQLSQEAAPTAQPAPGIGPVTATGGYPSQPPQTGQNYPQGSGPENGRQTYSRPGYPPLNPASEPPHPPVTLDAGTLIKVRTTEPVDSKFARDGAQLEFSVARDVYAGGVLVIPRGATVLGQVSDIRKAGALGGSPELNLNLQSLQMEGRAYTLDADPFQVRGPNKAGRTAGSAIGGALFGAIIGGAVGGGSGAAIGAGAGAVGGTAASAATPGPRAWIPSEAVIDFHLNAPVTVTPVSRQEAMRLAANQPSPVQRPTLYRRGPYRYAYPPPPPPPGYYYRPY